MTNSYFFRVDPELENQGTKATPSLIHALPKLPKSMVLLPVTPELDDRSRMISFLLEKPLIFSINF